MIPYLGQIVSAKAIGRTYGERNSGNRYIHMACPQCGKTRWVMLVRAKAEEPLCKRCAARARARRLTKHQMLGNGNPQWGGGRMKSRGYIAIWVPSSDPFFPMAHKGKSNASGYIYEHRLVMAQHLGRLLDNSECVHHRNGVRDDNRIENLYLTSKKTHPQSFQQGYLQGFGDAARLASRETNKEIRLLRWQIKELQQQLQIKLRLAK